MYIPSKIGSMTEDTMLNFGLPTCRALGFSGQFKV